MNNHKDNLPILAFKTQAAFEKWLAKNYSASNGVWLKVYKKDLALQLSVMRRLLKQHCVMDGLTDY